MNKLIAVLIESLLLSIIVTLTITNRTDASIICFIGGFLIGFYGPFIIKETK